MLKTTGDRLAISAMKAQHLAPLKTSQISLWDLPGAFCLTSFLFLITQSMSNVNGGRLSFSSGIRKMG